MKWPFMTKKQHDLELRAEQERHNRDLSRTIDRQAAFVEFLRMDYQDKVDDEYIRARDEGREQIRAWANAVQENLFYGNSPWPTATNSRLRGALPGAAQEFSPKRTILPTPTEIALQRPEWSARISKLWAMLNSAVKGLKSLILIVFRERRIFAWNSSAVNLGHFKKENDGTTWTKRQPGCEPGSRTASSPGRANPGHHGIRCLPDA